MEAPRQEDYTELRRKLLTRKQAMWTERSSWDPHWREIAQHQLPRAGRFFYSDTNKGGKRHNSIYDNTPIFAHRTLAAGMMSGITSPARPWFRLGVQDKDLMENGAVKQWLDDVATKMRSVFQASNTYNALHHCYEELGAFGTYAFGARKGVLEAYVSPTLAMTVPPTVKIVVTGTLQTTRDEAIFAMGDCAACVWKDVAPERGAREHDGVKIVPPRAQAAHQQAAHLVRQIKRRIAGQPLTAFRYRDFGSLVSLGAYSTVGSLMGGLVGGSLVVQGLFARLMYLSLYKKHELALHGPIKTTLDTLARMIVHRTEPRVKLH